MEKHTRPAENTEIPNIPEEGEFREIISETLKALAAIVTVHTSEDLFDLDAIPRAPVMNQVSVVKEQMDRLRVLTQDRNTRPESLQQARTVEGPNEPLFYLQDSRSYVGNCPLWWCPDGMGYTTRLDEAGKYTREDAMQQHRDRETDVPWPCDHIDAISRPTVDMQDMRGIAAQQEDET